MGVFVFVIVTRCLVSVIHAVARFMKFGLWSSDIEIYSALDGGFPLVVYDSDMKNAVVMSPLSTFMSATQASFTNQVTKETTLTFGPISSIDSVS